MNDLKFYSNVIFTTESFQPNIALIHKYVKYMVYQLEKSTSSYTHFQGYIELNRTLRLSTIKKLVGSEEVHIESRFGKREEAIRYCTKSESRIDGPWSFNVSYNMKDKENNNDMDYLISLLKGGWSDKELCNREPELWNDYGRWYIPCWRRNNKPTKDKKRIGVKLIVLYGTSGTGKSTAAVNFCKENKLSYYRKPGGIWFEGYEGEDVTIIDEIDKKQIPYDLLTDICDSTQEELTVYCKGGSKKFISKYVIVTSNLPIEQWYRVTPPEYEALYRRVSTYLHYTLEHTTVKVNDLTYQINKYKEKKINFNDRKLE
jgi:hypothetical protein